MKRFTETNKWDDPWFRGLPGVHKLVFLYVTDRCNNAGFWEVDAEAIAWHTKIDPKHIEGAWKGLQRGIIGASGWVWVRRFLRHQKNEALNPDNPAHKQILLQIGEQVARFSGNQAFDSFLAPLKGLLSPIGKGTGTGKGTEEGIAKGRFSPPTLAEARAYAEEIGFNDAESWHDHFTSNGWKVSGKAPMKDWRSAMRNAQRHPITRNGRTSPEPERVKCRDGYGRLKENCHFVNGAWEPKS